MSQRDDLRVSEKNDSSRFKLDFQEILLENMKDLPIRESQWAEIDT